MKRAVFDPTVFGCWGVLFFFPVQVGGGIRNSPPPSLIRASSQCRTCRAFADAVRPSLAHAHHPSPISLGSQTPASWSEFIPNHRSRMGA